MVTEGTKLYIQGWFIHNYIISIFKAIWACLWVVFTKYLRKQESQYISFVPRFLPVSTDSNELILSKHLYEVSIHSEGSFHGILLLKVTMWLDSFYWGSIMRIIFIRNQLSSGSPAWNPCCLLCYKIYLHNH